MQLKDYSIEKLAQLIPTKGVLYRIMVKNLNYFFPKEFSKTINENLLGVELFSLKVSEKKRTFVRG